MHFRFDDCAANVDPNHPCTRELRFDALEYTPQLAGRPVTSEIDLDPRLFTDFNRISVQMIAHYTLDRCADPYHSSRWTDVSTATTLTLRTAHVVLPDRLSLLPVPFFDRHDNSLSRAPFVLAGNAGVPTLCAAGVVAPWLGVLASYRSVRWPLVAAVLELALEDGSQGADRQRNGNGSAA